MLTKIVGTLLSLSLLGCGALGQATLCPARGGPAWREIRSPHFILRTDGSHDDAIATLGDFEATFAVLQDIGFPDITSDPPPVTIVLFDSDASMREFMPSGVDGRFYSRLPHDLEAEPTMVLPARVGEYGRVLFTHELTHAFVRRSYTWTPIWLNEGLAQYFSTLRIEEGRVVLGRPPPTPFPPTSMIPSAQAIVNADRATFYAGTSWDGGSVEGARRQAIYYAGAWWLVHMLMSGPDAYRERFQTFIHDVNEGTGFDAAWERTFGGDAAAKLDKDFFEYLRGEDGSLMEAKTSVRRGDGSAFEERIMGDEEVHLLWARLVPWEGETLGRAKADLDEAAQRAPESSSVARVRALFSLEQGSHEDAIRILDSALVQHPDDPRVLYTLAFAWQQAAKAAPTPDARAKLAATMARLSSVASTVDQRTAVAAYLGSVKRFDEGIAVIKRALAADPTSFRSLAMYARLLHATGRFAEAVAVQERAVAFLPEENRDRSFIEDLDRYRHAKKTGEH